MRRATAATALLGVLLGLVSGAPAEANPGDTNGGDRSAEHKLQRVIKAYHTLKKAKLQLKDLSTAGGEGDAPVKAFSDFIAASQRGIIR